ncbi:MAG: hypothetical protein WC325_01555 [Candidatus Bathyarchaeia archaeon]
MSEVIEKLRGLARLNFCEKCYSTYLQLFEGEIEQLLFEPLVDWKETEINIDRMWIKAKGFYTIVNSTVFSPNKTAFQKAKDTKLIDKLKFLREKGILFENTFKFLDQVSKRRNKIHPQYFEQNYFSKQDYRMFQLAKTLTNMIIFPIIYDLKSDEWISTFENVENIAKTFP